MTHLSKAWFTGGCFWTTEAVFEQVPGVDRIIVGDVWLQSGLPLRDSEQRFPVEKIETIEVYFDPTVADPHTLVDVLMLCVSPSLSEWELTSDLGGLRSAAIFEDPEHAEAGQKAIEAARSQLGDIKTQCVALVPQFVPRADRERGYFRKRPNDSYSRSIVYPKIEKLRAYLARKAAGQKA